jgi:hypothetical protein
MSDFDGEEFDPGIELSRLERARDFHLSEKTWFYAARAFLVLEGAAIGPWTVAHLRSDNGAVFEGVGCQHVFEIRTVRLRETIFVFAYARRGLDSARPGGVHCIVFKGRADSILGWRAIVRDVAGLEGVAVSLPGWAHEVCHQWDEYRRLTLKRIIPRFCPGR